MAEIAFCNQAMSTDGQYEYIVEDSDISALSISLDALYIEERSDIRRRDTDNGEGSKTRIFHIRLPPKRAGVHGIG